MSKISRLKITEKIKERNDKHPDKRKINRHYLAEKSGVHYATIDNLDNGRVLGKTLKATYIIAEILECTVDELIETTE